MPDYNAAVALDVKPPENSLAQTFNTIANIQQAQAHTGLYTLQEAQQRRQLEGYQAMAAAYGRGEDPVAVGMRYGVNAADLNQMQNVNASRLAMAANHNLMPQHSEQLAAAAEHRARTAEIGVNTQRSRADFAAKNAAGIFSDPTNDQAWYEAVDSHDKAFGMPKLVREQLLREKDPARRLQLARTYSGQGVSPDEINKPVPVQPGEGFTTAGRLMAPPVAAAVGGVAQSPMAVPPVSLAGKKEQEHRGEYLGQLPGKLTEDANNAKMQSYILDQMKQESQSWDMGKGAETMMKASQYMKPIANAFGSDYFDKPVADYEAFVKNSGTLVRTAVKEVSSRAAMQEFNLIAKQLPEPTMSRQGFYNIADQFHSVNDFKGAKEQAGAAWGRGHGTMEGFEADWNKNVTPAAFLVHRMSPEQLHKTLDGLQAAGPEGKAAIASIKRQLQYANQAGLF